MPKRRLLSQIEHLALRRCKIKNELLVLMHLAINQLSTLEVHYDNFLAENHAEKFGTLKLTLKKKYIKSYN